MHTPGPWTVGSDNGYGELNGVEILDARFYTLAVAIGDIPSLDSKVNARLIAAAPDLLSALKAMLDDLVDRDSAYNDSVKAARAAIAKATQP